jgi:hypothetical protein
MKDDGSKIISYKIAYADEPGKYQSIEMKSKCGVQVYDIEKILRCRLFGRDLYLETKDPHSRSEWEGKTIRVGWRMRGGMYKEDTWLQSPDPFEERERQITVSIACGEDWTTLSMSPFSSRESCLEFIRNKYGRNFKGMVRGKPLSESEIRDQDVVGFPKIERRKFHGLMSISSGAYRSLINHYKSTPLSAQ